MYSECMLEQPEADDVSCHVGQEAISYAQEHYFDAPQMEYFFSMSLLLVLPKSLYKDCASSFYQQSLSTAIFPTVASKRCN